MDGSSVVKLTQSIYSREWLKRGEIDRVGVEST